MEGSANPVGIATLTLGKVIYVFVNLISDLAWCCCA